MYINGWSSVYEHLGRTLRLTSSATSDHLMYIHTYIYIYIYIHRERDVYMYICKHVCMCIYIYIYIYITYVYVCVYIYIYIYVFDQFLPDTSVSATLSKQLALTRVSA